MTLKNLIKVVAFLSKAKMGFFPWPINFSVFQWRIRLKKLDK